MGYDDARLIDAAETAERTYPREGDAEAGQIMAWAMLTKHPGPFADAAETMRQWPCIAADRWHTDLLHACLTGDLVSFRRACAEAQAEAAELLKLVPATPGDQ